MDSTDSIVLDDSMTKSNQPPEIKIPLKQHQLTLLKHCSTLENSSNSPIMLTNNNIQSEIKSKFGIIGDIVGSGKTLSILAIIANQPVLHNKLSKFIHQHIVTCSEISLDEYQVKPFNIIVVPHTIYKQWTHAIETYTTLKYIGINNTKSLDKFKELFNTAESSEKVDGQIILISNTRFNDFHVFRKSPYWEPYSNVSRYIFDEADTLKIKGNITLNCSFMWFVSASYKSLLNPYCKTVWANDNGDISSYYSYSNGYTTRTIQGGLRHPGYIKNILCNIVEFPNKYKKYLVLRNSNEYVQKSFNLPPYIEHIIKCKTPHYLNILSKSVSQDIMNHINAGDLKGAIDKVNCPKFKKENLIQGITQYLETQLQNLNIELEMKSKMTFSSEKAKEESLEKIISNQKVINHKIESIKEKLESSDMCCICYDDLNNTSITPCCNSKYCFECISKWLHENKHCPFCRSKCDFNSLIIVTDSIKDHKKENLLSKLDNLKNIIEKQRKNPKFKMLIFSEYNSSFYKIKDILDEYNITHSDVVGTTNTINKTIRLYKDYESHEKIDVLFLNAKYCANGINLENSTDIVLFHSMDKDTNTQVIGRGQRPGRDCELNIWKLYYQNELNLIAV